MGEQIDQCLGGGLEAAVGEVLLGVAGESLEVPDKVAKAEDGEALVKRQLGPVFGPLDDGDTDD